MDLSYKAEAEISLQNILWEPQFEVNVELQREGSTHQRVYIFWIYFCDSDNEKEVKWTLNLWPDNKDHSANLIEGISTKGK